MTESTPPQMTDEHIPRGKSPRPLSELVNKVLGSMKVSDASSATGLFSHWPEIVGQSVAEHVTPKRLEKRVLTVEVDDPAWATQLTFLEAQLLSTLRQHIGDEVDSLNIKVRRSR
jgi:predicted nucleic acid-binding Zn ribbon protein